MTEAEERRQRAQVREYPMTMELFDRVRALLADRLFQTNLDQHAEREAMYLRVATIDAMKAEMQGLLESVASDAEIRAYVEELAKAEKDK